MNYPDIFTFADGRRMTGPAEWDERAAELRGQYEDCMYGNWRSGETVSYAISDEGAQMISFFGIIPAEGAKNLTVTVSVNAHNGGENSELEPADY